MKDRLPGIASCHMSDAQRAAAQAVIDGPRGAVYGPFVPLLRSPELMNCTQRMGEYLRYHNAIGTRLSELAILVIARQWDQQVEWAIHAPIAEGMGISQSTIRAIAERRRPQGMTVDESLVYDFCVQLQQDKRVDDDTYTGIVALFGEKGAVDLMGLNGYYTLLAIVMNAAQTAVPADASAARLP